MVRAGTADAGAHGTAPPGASLEGVDEFTYVAEQHFHWPTGMQLVRRVVTSGTAPKGWPEYCALCMIEVNTPNGKMNGSKAVTVLVEGTLEEAWAAMPNVMQQARIEVEQDIRKEATRLVVANSVPVPPRLVR